MSVYTSSKQIELGSAAFRQWKASHSHCRFLHGYQLKARFTFGCNSLDDKNWCVDFGGLNDLKKILRDQFDHTTVVAGDDPELQSFKDLNDKGVLQLRVMEEGVGTEKFAEWVFKTADTFIEEVTEGRCFVINVAITEHDNNWASYTRPIEEGTTYVDEEGGKVFVKSEEPAPEPEPVPEPVPQPAAAPPKRGANVGNKVSRGKGSWFEGTTWG